SLRGAAAPCRLPGGDRTESARWRPDSAPAGRGALLHWELRAQRAVARAVAWAAGQSVAPLPYAYHRPDGERPRALAPRRGRARLSARAQRLGASGDLARLDRRR